MGNIIELIWCCNMATCRWAIIRKNVHILTVFTFFCFGFNLFFFCCFFMSHCKKVQIMFCWKEDLFPTLVIFSNIPTRYFILLLKPIIHHHSCIFEQYMHDDEFFFLSPFFTISPSSPSSPSLPS